MAKEIREPSSLQTLAWQVLGDFVDRGRKSREEGTDRTDYKDLLTSPDRYKLKLEKTGKRKYVLRAYDKIAEETDEVPVTLSTLTGNTSYLPLIKEANQDYETRIQKQKEEKTWARQKRKENFRRGLRNLGRKSLKGLILTGVLTGVTTVGTGVGLGIKGCYNYTHSPTYLRAKELDVKASQILPQPGEIVAYILDNGQKVELSVRNFRNPQDMASKWQQSLRLAVDLGEAMLLSEWFDFPDTSEGDARNLSRIMLREPRKILHKGDIPNYSQWQTVYENLILQLAEKTGKKEPVIATPLSASVTDKELSAKLETILNELQSPK